MHLNFYFHTLFIKPLLKIYLRFNTSTKIDGFRIKILKGVFHPNLFFSTKYFYRFINALQLSNQQFLEIGSGTGILSMLAYKKGALVTSIDVDKLAVENTKLNFTNNFGENNSTTIFQSDVFQNISHQVFDCIVINPPYFFKKIIFNEQNAWYCGENGEYFYKFFSELNKFIHRQTHIYMVLADNCDIARIKAIAHEFHFSFHLVEQKKIKWEKNYIFKITSN